MPVHRAPDCATIGAGSSGAATSLIAPAARERHRPTGVMTVMALVESAAAAAYSSSSTLVASNIAIALLDFFAGGFGAAFYAYFQKVVTLTARGRVFALIRQIDAAAVLAAGALAALFAGLPGWLLLLADALAYAGCTIAVALLCSRSLAATVRIADVIARGKP